jgi:excisionase family DNA binding protein
VSDLLTIPETAERLKVSRSFAYQLAQDAVIPTIRIGKVVRVPAEALEQWLRHQTRLQAH